MSLSFIALLAATVCAVVRFGWALGLGIGFSLYVLMPYPPRERR